MNPQPINATQAASIEDAIKAGLRYVTPDEPGIHRRKHGRGFVYCDEHGAAIRDNSTLSRIQSLVIPPAWDSVWICPSARGHLQATGRDQKGRRQYIYHESYRQARDFNKFNRMVTFGTALPRIRRIVGYDLTRPDIAAKRKVMAVVVRLLDETCVRIGNDEYSRKNGSYGLTTLENKHVRIDGPNIQFHFRAKSGVQQDISLTDPDLANILRRLRDLPGSHLFGYRAEDGFHKIESTDINDYLRGISQADVTAKDFRTWHGTVQMIWELSQVGPATSAAEAKRRLAKAVRITASRLGNQPATCRGYYVHPDVIESYLNRRMFGTPLNPKSLHDCERALLSLVRKVHKPRFGMKQKVAGRGLRLEARRSAPPIRKAVSRRLP